MSQRALGQGFGEMQPADFSAPSRSASVRATRNPRAESRMVSDINVGLGTFTGQFQNLVR
jgi:hypothetical protein